MVNCSFVKRKSKFASKVAVCKRKLRVTNEEREKQHKIDKTSKKKNKGNSSEGRKKSRTK